MKFNDFTTIISGYAFRDALKYTPNGSTRVVLISDIVPNRILTDDSDLLRVDGSKLSTRAFLLDGDILLTARGTISSGFKATVYRGKHSDTIVTSTMCILRPNESVVSEYVALWLNSHQGRTALVNIARGSAIQTISVREIGEIDIPLIDTKTQQTLVSLSQNIVQQERLHKEKVTYLESVLDHSLTSLSV